MTDESGEPQQDGSRDRASALARWVLDLDRRPDLVALVRRTRRALPGDPGFGDPLSTAGPGSARAVARVADRLLTDQSGASREVGLAALQVWEAARERAGRGGGDTEVTLVFTDLVGFSSWALAAGDGATLRMLREVAATAEPEFVNRDGRIVKRMGDGLMAVFRDPARAVDAVFAARRALAEVEVAGYRPVMRVGIHTGTPRRIGADWLGVDVNIAARLMQAGGNGNVMISAPSLERLGDARLAEMGMAAKPLRRFFSSRARGVPDDLRMYTLTSTS